MGAARFNRARGRAVQAGYTAPGRQQYTVTTAVAKTYDHLAREFTQVAIERGAFPAGHPASSVGEFYKACARALQEVEIEVGAEAMNSAAEFTITSIRVGLIYAGGEALEFVNQVSQHIREANRQLGGQGHSF